MTQNADTSSTTVESPFKTERISLQSVSIDRPQTEVKAPQELPITAQVAFFKATDRGPYVLHLRLRSDAKDTAFKFDVVVAGAFTYLPDNSPSDKDLNLFINSYLLMALSLRAIQVLGSLSAEMNMPPVWIDMPRVLGFNSHPRLNQSRQANATNLLRSAR